MELGFWISIVSEIPDSLSCIPHCKAQDSGFHKQKFHGFRNPDSLTWGESLTNTLVLSIVLLIETILEYRKGVFFFSFFVGRGRGGGGGKEDLVKNYL